MDSGTYTSLSSWNGWRRNFGNEFWDGQRNFDDDNDFPAIEEEENQEQKEAPMSDELNVECRHTNVKTTEF